MFETSLTVIGHVISDLRRRSVGDQEVISFRMASNSRRRTSDGGWETANSLFITVNCWGKLVGGVGAALGKGAPVIVTGHVYTSEYDDREGIRRSSLELRATAVGPDLSRAFVRIEKPGYTGPSAADAAASDLPANGSNGDLAVDTEPVLSEDDGTASSTALPLSA